MGTFRLSPKPIPVRHHRCHVLALLFALASVPALGQLAGDWSGRLELPGGQSLAIVFHLAEAADGYTATLDSPDQGAFGLPVSRVRATADSLVLEAADLGMSFAGALDADAQRAVGEFRQGPGRLPLTLARTEADTSSAAADAPPARPQEPTDFPYLREEVAVDVGAHTLVGTLTLPEGRQPIAAVGLVSGSGPSDRDESVFGHRPFLVLADYLTRRGVAVLRYDDRGVGASTGDQAAATSADFAEDAAAVAGYLRARPELAGVPVGLVGHSEGGMIVPLAHRAHAGAIDFAVLLAPPGIRIDSLLPLQIDRGAELQGAPADLRAANGRALRRAFAHVVAHPGLDSAALHAALTELMRGSLADFPAEVQASIPDAEAFAREETRAFTGPWFRYFIAYDPAPALRGLDVPTLALFGGLDAQVTPAENAAGLLSVLPQGDRNAVEVLPGLNHLFQPATTGSSSEYAGIAVTMDEAVLARVGDWIEDLTEGR